MKKKKCKKEKAGSFSEPAFFLILSFLQAYLPVVVKM